MDAGASGGGEAALGSTKKRSGLKGVVGIGISAASALTGLGGVGGVSASVARGLTDQQRILMDRHSDILVCIEGPLGGASGQWC